MMETVVGRLRDSGDLDERNSELERMEAIRNEMSGSIDADILHCPQGLENNLGPFRRTFLAVLSTTCAAITLRLPTPIWYFVC